MNALDHMLKGARSLLASRGQWYGPRRPGRESLRTPTAEKGRCVVQIVRIGLDLAKYVFEVHGVDAEEKVVLRKTLRRDAVASFFAELPACIVGMEACSGAHYWAKVLSELGHEVRLISPQFVTPYVKSNKSDRNDAEAICEAVGRPSMRFVPQKSADQLALQAVHRVRQRLVSDRTRLVNQIRGLLAEHGIAIARDISRLRTVLAKLVDGDNSGLGDLILELVRDAREELVDLDRRIASYNRRSRLSSGPTRCAGGSARSRGSAR